MKARTIGVFLIILFQLLWISYYNILEYKNGLLENVLKERGAADGLLYFHFLLILSLWWNCKIRLHAAGYAVKATRWQMFLKVGVATPDLIFKT
jgi:hypothetical protein